MLNLAQNHCTIQGAMPHKDIDRQSIGHLLLKQLKN